MSVVTPDRCRSWRLPDERYQRFIQATLRAFIELDWPRRPESTPEASSKCLNCVAAQSDSVRSLVGIFSAYLSPEQRASALEQWELTVAQGGAKGGIERRRKR